MNTDLSKIKFNFDSGTWRILYLRHKVYLIPVIVILVSILVFLFVVVGQISDFFSSKERLTLEQEKIATLQSNLNILSSMDDTADDLQLVLQALPSEKDFAGIVNAISAASSVTGVSVADYSFQVGLLKPQAGSPETPSIPLVLTIQAGPDGARKFLALLSKTSPLSSVATIQSDSGSSTLRLLFYYRSLPPLRVDYTVPLRPITQSDKDLLKKLSDWQVEAKAVNTLTTKTATVSASR